MLINSEMIYALQIVAYLYGSKKYVNTKRIAKDEKLSVLFVRKVATKLVNAGILTAVEGVNGGLMLKKNFPLADVVHAVGDPIVFAGRHKNKKIEKLLLDIKQRFLRTLNYTKINKISKKGFRYAESNIQE